MREKMLDLLEHVSGHMPPPEGSRGHHAITYDDGKFVLQVIRPDGRFQPFTFDEEDEAKTIDQLLSELIDMASRPYQ